MYVRITQFILFVAIKISQYYNMKAMGTKYTLVDITILVVHDGYCYCDPNLVHKVEYELLFIILYSLV